MDNSNNFTPYDWTGSNIIVFDEVLLNNMYFLSLIKTFVNENYDKIKIIANGDVDQLKPINQTLNNIQDEIKYRMGCIKQIFPNIITLKEIKRLKTKSDKIKMKR